MKNKEQDIVCLTGLFPEEYVDEINKYSLTGVQNAANKLQWGIVKGLDALGENVTVFNSIYVGSYPRLYRKIMIPTFHFSHGSEKNDINIGFINIAGIKVLSRYYTVKRELDKWASVDSGREKVLLIYAMTTPFAQLAGYIKRKYSSIKVIYIIPDLPMYMNVTKVQESLVYRTRKKIEEFLFHRSLKNVDGYVLLTDGMKEWFTTDINYTVVEGMATIDNTIDVDDIKKKKQILYAGGIKREYGVIDLVSAFSQIDDPEWELVIYGDGTDMESVCEYAKKDVRIKIMGSAPNAVVMKHQREAALLINPRKNQEMAKYSFPSKTLEYMLSGTPMLGYKLAGIPEEYYDNMFVIQDSENGMEEALRKAMNLPETERIKMGEKAKNFVVKEKNPEKQCKKILELIGRLE
jgi:glycosyltransferase, family 1